MNIPYWCNGFTCLGVLGLLLFAWLKAREAGKKFMDIVEKDKL